MMRSAERFSRETRGVLRMEVDGSAWIKPGAAIAYRGGLHFERLATLDARSPREAILRELAPLVRAVGTGTLFCGHNGSHVLLRQLAGETIVVSWENLLAFESGLTFDACLVEHALGVAAGGIVVVKLSGEGSVALATHGESLTLPVSHASAVNTDPHATVAWSGTLSPRLETDISWRTAVGHGGHQAVQMKFEGAQGFVVVQPSRHEPQALAALKMLKQLTGLATG